MCSFTIEATDGFAAEDGSQARVARCRRFCHKTDEHEQPLHHLPTLHWGRTFLGDPELAAKTKEYLEKELKVESGQPYKHKRRRFDRKLNEGAPRTCFDLEDLDGCYRCVQPEWTKQQPDIARVDSQEPESQWKHELKNMVHDLEAQEIDTQKPELKSFTPVAWGEILKNAFEASPCTE